MKKNYLLKPIYGKNGWIMLIIGVLFLTLGLTNVIPEINAPVFCIWTSELGNNYQNNFFVFDNNNIVDEIGTILIMVSLFLIVFSAEKDEDEFTDALRLRSWYLSGISYAIVYVLSDLFIYGIAYVQYMWFIQGGLIFLIFIIIFKTKLYKYRRSYDGQ